ncbi:MAG: Amuc_1100 family pilus-like protein, partial [Verrucomicrobiales bacterium]
FLSILILVTLVLAGAIGYVGMGAAGKAEEAAQEIETKKSAISRLESGKPYPDAQNVKEMKENLGKVLGKAREARELLLSYRPEEIKNISSSEFTAIFDKTEAEIRQLYQGKDIALPEEWHLGFEKYKGSPVERENTGILVYQMSVIDWLFRQVADAGVSEVNSFYREALPPENGQPWGGAPQAEPAKKGRRGANKPAPASAPVAKSLPFEIAVTGREESLRKLLSALSNSPDHFIVVRALRVQNEMDEAPNERQVKFQDAAPSAPAADVFGGGGFVFPTDDAAPAEEAPAEEAPAEGEEAAEEAPAEEAPAAGPSDTGRILQIVAGDEKLKYFIRGEILLFDEEAKLPEAE